MSSAAECFGKIDMDSATSIRKGIKELKSAKGLLKSAHTRCVTKASADITKFDTKFAEKHGEGMVDSSDSAVKAVNTTITSLNEALAPLLSVYDMLITLLQNLEELDEPLTDEDGKQLTTQEVWEAESAERQDKHEEALMALQDLSAKQRPAPQSHSHLGQTTSASSTKRVKLDEAFKPMVLQVDDNHNDLDTWIRRARQYFSAEILETYDLASINLTLTDLLSAAVRNSINFNPDGKVPLFGEVSIVSQLSDVWEKRYPLTMRRKELFQIKQGQNERYRDFRARITAAAAKCDLENFRPNNIIAFLLLAGLHKDRNGDKIRDQMSRSTTITEGNLKPEDIDVLADTEEYADTMRPMNSSVDTAYRVSHRHANNKKSTTDKKKLEKLKADGLCRVCAEKEHEAGTPCPHKSKVCNLCHLKGHVAKACCQIFEGKPNPRK